MHPGEVKSFGGAKPFRKALSPLGKYGKWILSHNAVVKVNDVLFCHAGLTSTVAKMSLAEINQAVRRLQEQRRRRASRWVQRFQWGPLSSISMMKGADGI